MIKGLGKSGKLLLTGTFLVFLGLFFYGIQTFLKIGKTSSRPEVLVPETTNQVQVSQDTSDYWDKYINPEYMFSIKYPRFLSAIEIQGQGGYLVFVRFEEDSFSQGKGVAVGVSDRGAEEEVGAVKKEIAEGVEAKLVKEDKITIAGTIATRLEYEPINPNEGEQRVVVVLNNGKYSFSVSTTPDQIDQVLTNLKFLETFKGCKDIREEKDIAPFLQSYCSGEVCSQQKTKETCGRLDALKLEETGLPESGGKDKIRDCVWVESESPPNQCRPRY